MDHLTKQQENFCETAGLFGVMIAVACLIQMAMVMIAHWIPFTIIGAYILCAAGFILLMKKSTAAFHILFISTIIIFLLEAFMIFSLTFSLVLLILLVYLLIIVALLYSGDIPKQLKKKKLAQKEEDAKWSGIV